jgi:hypothetical protein
MRFASAAWLALAALALGGAHELGVAAADARDAWPKTLDEPWAPSPGMTPYVSVGYRELLADILWVRAIGYLGGHDDTADGVAALVEATAAADPHFRRVYVDGVRAIMSSHHGFEPSHALRAAELAERGAAVFPRDFEIADLAGTIYSVRIPTKDPAQKRAWEEKGAMLIEHALRLPGATAEDATFAAYLRSTLGEHERAVRELREMALITDDTESRKEIVKKLAELEKRDADAIEAATEDARRQFEAAWQRERPEVPPTMYVVVGAPLAPSFDLRALATDRDLVGSSDVEELEPIDYSK